MKILLSWLLLLFVPWCGWASCSEGGFTDLKRLNPGFAQEDRNLAHLVALYNDHDSPAFWQTDHVEQCSVYMPNWSDADDCFRARVACEVGAPLSKYGETDLFSKEYIDCFAQKRPFRGPLFWLRASRSLWRVAVGLGSGYLVCGGDVSAQCEENHQEFLRSLLHWMERSS